ncbi:MAG: isochorismatase family cysteine hydrolase [Chloroflexota bacterium]|nr:isochorismatase family cysteine hydrolase [Chloroflexota bacterium]
MANVVLVVDMVRGFCEEGYPLYVGETIRQIIPNIRRLLDEEKGKGSRVIFVCDNHAPDDQEFEMFPPHCIRGTEEAEIVPELREFADEVIPKTRFSGFYGTHLEERLRELGPDKVIVVGDCTDICVLHTVADARNRDYRVEVPADCVATFDQEAHRFALRHMEKVLGAKVTGPSTRFRTGLSAERAGAPREDTP